MRCALFYFVVGWLDWLAEQRRVSPRELLPARQDGSTWRGRAFAAGLVLAVLLLAGVPLGELVRALPPDTLERPNVMPGLASAASLSLLLVAVLASGWCWQRARRLAQFCREMHDRGEAIITAREALQESRRPQR